MGTDGDEKEFQARNLVKKRRLSLASPSIPRSPRNPYNAKSNSDHSPNQPHFQAPSPSKVMPWLSGGSDAAWVPGYCVKEASTNRDVNSPGTS